MRNLDVKNNSNFVPIWAQSENEEILRAHLGTNIRRKIVMGVFAIINQKGGVGKTTTAFNMATELANQGKKVLCMDMDPQGNLTTAMGFKSSEIENNIGKIFQILIRREPMPDLDDYILSRGKVHLIGSNLTLSVADISIVTATAREYILKKIIAQVKQQYDYIIIDCPPTLGMLVVNILTAADSIIIPIGASEMDAQGLEPLLDTIEMIRLETNPNLTIKGVLVTMYRARFVECREALDSLYEICPQYGVKIFETKIGDSTTVGRAFRKRKTLAEYDENSSLALEYKDFVQEVLKFE